MLTVQNQVNNDVITIAIITRLMVKVIPPLMNAYPVTVCAKINYNGTVLIDRLGEVSVERRVNLQRNSEKNCLKEETNFTRVKIQNRIRSSVCDSRL